MRFARGRKRSCFIQPAITNTPRPIPTNFLNIRYSLELLFSSHTQIGVFKLLFHCYLCSVIAAGSNIHPAVLPEASRLAWHTARSTALVHPTARDRGTGRRRLRAEGAGQSSPAELHQRQGQEVPPHMDRGPAAAAAVDTGGTAAKVPVYTAASARIEAPGSGILAQGKTALCSAEAERTSCLAMWDRYSGVAPLAGNTPEREAGQRNAEVEESTASELARARALGEAFGEACWIGSRRVSMVAMMAGERKGEQEAGLMR